MDLPVWQKLYSRASATRTSMIIAVAMESRGAKSRGAGPDHEIEAATSL